jgi:hypothetical protein
VCRGNQQSLERRAVWIRRAALAVLATYLLFCHGCHGDEDNELIAARAGSMTSAAATEAALLASQHIPIPVSPIKTSESPSA